MPGQHHPRDAGETSGCLLLIVATVLIVWLLTIADGARDRFPAPTPTTAVPTAVTSARQAEDVATVSANGGQIYGTSNIERWHRSVLLRTPVPDTVQENGVWIVWLVRYENPAGTRYSKQRCVVTDSLTAACHRE